MACGKADIFAPALEQDPHGSPFAKLKAYAVLHKKKRGDLNRPVRDHAP
jgi:hypothetical protein